jgi:hypothetical protein
MHLVVRDATCENDLVLDSEPGGEPLQLRLLAAAADQRTRSRWASSRANNKIRVFLRRAYGLRDRKTCGSRPEMGSSKRSGG